jgi:hypothetical protein
MNEDCMATWEQEHGISHDGIYWQHRQAAEEVESIYIGTHGTQLAGI